MKNESYRQKYSLQEYIARLQKYAYQDLKNYEIVGIWKKIPAFAQVVLSDLDPFKIHCHFEVQQWPEPALFGLLAHELSHIVLRKRSSTEYSTDKDVISRGLGTYLALERVFAGKYLDPSMKSHNDKYIGYSEIRKTLNKKENEQLDSLLVGLSLIPSPRIADIGEHDDILFE